MENYYLENNPDLIFSEGFTSSFFLRDRDDVIIVGNPRPYKDDKKKFMKFSNSDELLTNLEIDSGVFGGISFWMNGNFIDSYLLETDHLFFPIKLNSSEYSTPIQLNIGENKINFGSGLLSGNNYITINFSEKYECYVNSEKISLQTVSGFDNGIFPYTGINKICPSFEGNGIYDLIILNRNFEGSEITGLYNKSIWRYNDNISSLIDFSSNPLIDTVRNLSLSSGNNFSIVSGSEDEYFSFRFPQSTGISIDNNSIFTGDLSIISLIKYRGNMNYSFFDKYDDTTGIYLGISGNKFCAVLSNGILKKDACSIDNLEENVPNYINFSYKENSINLYINDSLVPIIYGQNDEINSVYNTGLINISKPNVYFTNYLSGDIDELRIY